MRSFRPPLGPSDPGFWRTAGAAAAIVVVLALIVLAPDAELLGSGFGVRLSRNEWHGATNGSGAITV